MAKKFRVAWITEPGHNFTPLLELADTLRFVLSGMEFGAWEITTTVEQNLREFNPALDLVVPSGRILSCWGFAQAVAAKMVDGEGYYNVAIWKDGSYEVVQWQVPSVLNREVS